MNVEVTEGEMFLIPFYNFNTLRFRLRIFEKLKNEIRFMEGSRRLRQFKKNPRKPGLSCRDVND